MRRALTIVVAATTFLLLGGIAWASIPGPDGVIHGCYKNNNPAQGTVIVIDSAASCPSGYTPLDWNQAGPPGLSGWEKILTEASVPGGESVWGGDAVCPTGKNMLGGGARLDQAGTYWLIEWSIPSTTGWQAQFRRAGPETTSTGNLRVWVICATAN